MAGILAYAEDGGVIAVMLGGGSGLAVVGDGFQQRPHGFLCQIFLRQVHGIQRNLLRRGSHAEQLLPAGDVGFRAVVLVDITEHGADAA